MNKHAIAESYSQALMDRLMTMTADMCRTMFSALEEMPHCVTALYKLPVITLHY
jgi:hypothetical protein